MTEKKSFILQLYLKYNDYLRSIAHVCGAAPDDTDDYIQDTFEIALKKVDELMRSKDPKVWLAKTLKNCINNHNRLHENRFTCSLEDYCDFPAPEGDEPLSNILPAQLSDSEKQVLIWRFEEDIGYEEMSRRLGTTEVYCRVKVCRLIKKCRGLMKK